MPYSLRSAPTLNTLNDVRQWVEEELGYIEQAQHDTKLFQLQPSFRDVDKPRDGMIVYADGVSFNPGAGAGSYEYRAGAWHKLAEDVDLSEMETDIADLESAVAANTAAIAGPTAVAGFGNGSDAAAGKIGEYLSSVVQAGSAVPVLNVVAKDVLTLVLTAGDWDVWGDLFYTVGADTFRLQGWIGTASVTVPSTLPAAMVQIENNNGSLSDGINPITLNGLRLRLNVASTTTLFLSTIVSIDTGTMAAYGQLQARRVR